MSVSAAGPPHERHRRRVRLGALLVLAVVAGAGGAWVAIGRDGERSPGPLMSPEATSGGFGRTAGKPFGFGLAVAWNTGKRPAVLERIDPVDPTPGLRVLETWVAGADRESLAVAATREWPSSDFTDLRPVRGFEVAPRTDPAGERGVELVFALQADRPGRYVIRGVAVEYTVDGERHRAIIRNGIGVCVTAPGEPTVRGCDAPLDLAGEA